MSRVLQTKNKDLVNLVVKQSKDVWHKNSNGKYVLNNKYDYYGKVEKGTSAFVVRTNLDGTSAKFVDDTSNLSKKTKNEIVKSISNGTTKVVYLVKNK